MSEILTIFSPGLIRTSSLPQELGDLVYNKSISITPLKRVGDPIDIAKGISFLASTDADFITGANIVIDGGLIYNQPANFIETILQQL